MIKISKRLCTAASYVRDGAVVADIGTDHAYLPIYLALNNRISSAIASDINEGPIKKARENIAKHNLCDQIYTCVADGLDGIEKYAPNDIVICGMGGETIINIITEGKDITPDTLILQPMTGADKLRKFLYENGYRITDESFVTEGEKVYCIIKAQKNGENNGNN